MAAQKNMRSRAVRAMKILGELGREGLYLEFDEDCLVLKDYDGEIVVRDIVAYWENEAVVEYAGTYEEFL